MAKERYLAELEEELRKKNEYEERIRELEKKESELIEVLQNTNQAEMQALEGLKQVLNGDTGDFANESFESGSDKYSGGRKKLEDKESFKFL